MDEQYFNKVAIIAKVTYEIEENVLLSYIDVIKQCYKQNYTPRRTVEVVAEYLYG